MCYLVILKIAIPLESNDIIDINLIRIRNRLAEKNITNHERRFHTSTDDSLNRIAKHIRSSAIELHNKK